MFSIRLQISAFQMLLIQKHVILHIIKYFHKNIKMQLLKIETKECGELKYHM